MYVGMQYLQRPRSQSVHSIADCFSRRSPCFCGKGSIGPCNIGYTAHAGKTSACIPGSDLLASLPKEEPIRLVTHFLLPSGFSPWIAVQMEDFPNPKPELDLVSRLHGHREDQNTTIRTTTAVTWAIQVHIVKLGAHLETYSELQPVFTALRLCHRFGEGENAFVHRLSVELILKVEEWLTADLRASKIPDWETDFECYEGRCRGKVPFSYSRDSSLRLSQCFGIHLRHCDHPLPP